MTELVLIQLVTATRVNFVMSEDTTLADLLNLNLHNFEDEVHNIVDKAIKEMAMERMLKELEVIWSAMEFHHETHARTGYTLLRTRYTRVVMEIFVVGTWRP